MSEQHEFTCDACGATVTAWCDGRRPAEPPPSWLQVGSRDYCDDCAPGILAGSQS